MGELELHVHDRDIIVNLPGTRLRVTYRVSLDKLVEHPLWTGEDRNAPVSLPGRALPTAKLTCRKTCPLWGNT